MTRSCHLCPPDSFKSHGFCHNQATEFRKYTILVEKDKENISVALHKKIAICSREIHDQFQSCVTENDFLKFGKRLKTANQILRLVFEICDLRR